MLKDWSDALLVPIPKKGDLGKCDNWRGIALLDTVGKVAARIIQERPQALAEEELPESQCGFRKRRGNAEEIKVNECQFADDAALLATTKRGAELITTEYMLVGKDFGLTLSIPKTKVMTVGREVTAEDITPLSVGEEAIESAVADNTLCPYLAEE